MARKYNDVFVKCPFYSNSHTTSISCEGISEDSITRVIFKDSKKMNLHRMVCCEQKYWECEIYKMLEKKYEN